jgi:rhodanese-related sulfurtransferase
MIKYVLVLLLLGGFHPLVMAEDLAAIAQQNVRKVMESVEKIDSVSLKTLLDKDQDVVLLDVRTPTEIKSMGKIDAKQQVEIPRGWLEIQIFNHVVDKDTPVVAYCGGGIRSALAVDTLNKMGFTNVKNYEAGFLGWEKKGYPAKY